MICKHCNTENADDAQFCHSCGKSLMGTSKNIMDLYPEYKFIPTNLEKWELNGICAVCVILSGCFIYAALALIVVFFYDNNIPLLVSAIVFLCGLIPCFVVFKKNHPSKNAPKLSEIADYVQKPRSTKTKYYFYIKDGKFGVLDVSKYKVQIPAQYDKLEWREKGRYLNAIKDSENIIIDINGKILK